jgi:DNA (cytosine-5)-methyltransferase 1
MWILPKQLHTSAFVQDTKALGLDSEEFSQTCEKSLTWRGKDSLSRTWLQRWKRENWIQHLSSRTLNKTADGESVLKYVLRELEGLGYRATAGVFSAEEVGAPHQRKRVFILGMANSEDIGRGGRTHRNRDDGSGLQEQEAQEQPNLRGETAGRSRDSRGELGNSDSQRCEGERLRIQQWEEGKLSRRSSQELGNASSDGCQDGHSEAFGEVRESQEGRVQEPQRGSNATPELANGYDEGLEGYQRHSSSEQGEPIQADPWSTGSIHWPARPGEPQYEWEEPRVTAVADSKSQQGSSSDNGGKPRASSQSQEVQPGGGHSGSLRESNGQAESELGRTSNGSTCGVDATANRVDRLRLLGNGVVNQTAAKAFVTLIQRVANK